MEPKHYKGLTFIHTLINNQYGTKLTNKRHGATTFSITTLNIATLNITIKLRHHSA
jgi:hypothetical protein